MAKIFVSHSSKDKEIVDIFKNIILNTGLGISDSDIAYTSAPETGVPLGVSIPGYIKDNIANSDFVFLMISDNYRKSEVCLNEMGAAWALNKNVKPMLLCNVTFETVGLLYKVHLCSKIDNIDMLDELRDEFVIKYGNQTKTVVWNRAKSDFVSKISVFEEDNENKRIDNMCEDDLGLLDFREMFDYSIDIFIQIIDVLKQESCQLNEKTKTRVKQLNALNKQNPNTTQFKGILVAFAKDMNQLSDVIDDNAPKLSKHFRIAMENAIKMGDCCDMDNSVKEKNKQALNELIQSQISAKEAITKAQNVILQIKDFEKTQIAAKKRLAQSYAKLIAVFDECITNATNLLKA